MDQPVTHTFSFLHGKTADSAGRPFLQYVSAPLMIPPRESSLLEAGEHEWKFIYNQDAQSLRLMSFSPPPFFARHFLLLLGLDSGDLVYPVRK